MNLLDPQQDEDGDYLSQIERENDDEREPMESDEDFLNQVDKGYIGYSRPKVVFNDYSQEDYLPIDSGMVPGDEV